MKKIKGRILDITNQRFGKLVALKIVKDNKGLHKWFCQCDCGKTACYSGGALRCANNRSCGCLFVEMNQKNGCESKTWGGFGEIPQDHFNSIKNGAVKRNLKFELDIKYLWDLFLKQDRQCALTGLDLKFGSRKLKQDITASLDRIDSLRGYTKDNVQWVHKDINIMKQDLPEDKFIYYCKLILQKQLTTI